MKDSVVCLIFCSTIFVGGLSKEFPENWKCAYGDERCIEERINDILKSHAAGDASINLVSIDPLDVSLVHIEHGEGSPVNINLKLSKNKIFGLNNARAEVKGFGKDIKGPHELHLKMPVLTIIGDYEINGRVLLLPIAGKGASNITFVNPDLKFKFEGKSVEKGGKAFMQISKYKIMMKIDRLVLNFENLFNGDKNLGENMNKFLNENWKDIFTEIQKPVEEVIVKTGKDILGKVFGTFPYEDVFIKEK